MDVTSIRKDFPQLTRFIRNKPIVYLDSAATSLKPIQVLEKEDEYYKKYCANIFRGIYDISEEATAEYEAVREITKNFFHSNDANEIIFTRNTTESLNLLAYSLYRGYLHKGDEVVSTILEHHSNFVPWQQLSPEYGVVFNYIGVTNEGELDVQSLSKVVTAKTKVFTFTAVSNVSGAIADVYDIVKRVRKISPSCFIIVDAAQAAPHMEIHVSGWGADAVACSSHKMLGPTGIGVLWVSARSSGHLKPFLYGGEMIKAVYKDRSEFKEMPHLFEAGTPHIAGVIGFGKAIEYLEKIGMEKIRRHEVDILSYAFSKFSKYKDITIIGPKDPRKRGGVIAFTVKGIHSHDVAQILNEDNICIRAGNHCAMPFHTALNIPSSARISFYIYTTRDDIDTFFRGIDRVKKVFS
ncbi:SufS family cysteine desulfurase [Candidatus Gottesmanbacteria bacterium]|nr:SufS family cysteine desulfurase [Candidatus Gottesmanbacteria bacterium]